VGSNHGATIAITAPAGWQSSAKTIMRRWKNDRIRRRRRRLTTRRRRV
jgi:hypothetical protein